jgi:hypothetical protein
MEEILTMVIRGTPIAAFNECKARGIQNAVLKSWIVEHGNVVVTAPAVYKSLAVRWFCEDTPCQPGTGFPAGTLLLYS